MKTFANLTPPPHVQTQYGIVCDCGHNLEDVPHHFHQDPQILLANCIL